MAPIRPLAWEPPYAAGAAPEEGKKTKKKKENTVFLFLSIFFHFLKQNICFSFQGCIFTIQVRTKKNSRFRSLGTPEGHPNAGRSVGQCETSPCHLMKCDNGGTCMESGSTV